jgi:phosphohistidine phosphatase
MLNVTLLRHAKSSWDDPELTDFDRPLNHRGVNAARLMAEVIERNDIAPDLICCSSARRTRETLAHLLPRLTAPGRHEPEVVYDDALYLANASALLDTLRGLPRTCRHVMLIGHNPGLHALALDLIGAGVQADVAAIARKFPTAALAALAFDAQEWRRLQIGSGKLVLFATPRSVEG